MPAQIPLHRHRLKQFAHGAYGFLLTDDELELVEQAAEGRINYHDYPAVWPQRCDVWDIARGWIEIRSHLLDSFQGVDTFGVAA